MNEDKRSAVPDFKGKGKEAASPSSASAPEHGAGSNSYAQHHSFTDEVLIGRIASSASSLSRAALSSRPENLSVGSSGKAQSGTASALKLTQQGRTANYYHNVPTSSSSGTGSMFAQQQNLSIAEETRYDDFLEAHADPGDIPHPELSHPETSLFNQLGATSAISQQETSDGREVMDLLNMPGELEDSGDIIDSLQSFLSPKEELSLREALFGNDGTRSGSTWNALLDFEPNFLRSSNPAEVCHYFGDVNLRRARELWMDNWNEVLTSYADKVWGDLGSLVREAQRELDEAREHGQQQGTGDTKALQRLRLILAHVRGHLK